MVTLLTKLTVNQKKTVPRKKGIDHDQADSIQIY